MSEFVNYSKREVTLPPGCKNLIDVLSNAVPANLAVPATGTKKQVARNKSFTAPLSDIGKYVAMAFESHGLMFRMILTSPDSRLTVFLTRSQGEVRALAKVQKNSTDEKVIAEFFAYHGLAMPADFEELDLICPGLPRSFRYKISPLSSDPFVVSQLVKDLFRYVCDLSGNTELKIHYDEIIDVV